MPKVALELSAIDIKRLAHRGGSGGDMHAVGGVAGLYLLIAPSGAKSWVLRMRVGERRRDIGIGGYPTVTLSQARDKARVARTQVEAGIDPIEERKAARARLVAAQRRGLTFKEAVGRCLASRLEGFKNPKHRAQWVATLDSYALPAIGEMLVQDIEARDVLRVLEPIWAAKTETASRLRGRIEAVLTWATVAGHRTGDNPARWAGNLKELLPAPRKVALEGNQPALQLVEAARWFSDLRGRPGAAARALEFAALTAARSGEVRGATWDEIDVERHLWIIPGSRMKAGKEHRVPLSQRAIDLLLTLPRFEGSPLIFAAPRGGALSDMSLSMVMRRIHEASVAAGGSGYLDRVSSRPAVPHGLRSTFRDWAAEHTDYPSEMAEVALAHRISNAVEAAYRRGDMVEKRRQMMADWVHFLEGQTGKAGQVITLVRK